MPVRASPHNDDEDTHRRRKPPVWCTPDVAGFTAQVQYFAGLWCGGTYMGSPELIPTREVLATLLERIVSYYEAVQDTANPRAMFQLGRLTSYLERWLEQLAFDEGEPHKGPSWELT